MQNVLGSMSTKTGEKPVRTIELTVAMDMKLHTFFHPVSNKEIKQLITTLDG